MPQNFKILLIFFGVLLIHFSLMYYFGRGATTSRSKAMKLIVDTDAGSDDAVALTLALSVPDRVDVLAVTCSYGNTKEANVEINVMKVLTIAGRSDIPVYAGAANPLLQNYTAGNRFGEDGLGDFEFGRKIEGSVDRSRHAALAMIELARKYPGEVSVLTLGPMTNLALAIKLDEDFTKNVRRFYVMGSTINNSTDDQVEFNFSLDPEANEIFLNSKVSMRSLISPWDVVAKNGISKKWRKDILGSLDSERVRFLNQAEYALLERLGVWYSADSIAVATLVWPELIVTSLEARMLPSTSRDSHRGGVELDHAAESNVEIVRDFDVEGYKEKLLRHLAQGNMTSKKNKLIIDTDTGADDAVALLLAMAVPEKVEILAITCIYGNTWLKNVEKNVLKTLTIANQLGIPVYSGADKPLLQNFTASAFFGEDGFNDVRFDRQIAGSIDRSKHAAIAMVDLVKQYPGEVSIVALGPLTNLALASSLDPNFSRSVKRFYAMGSSPDKTGFNFALDPESDAIFLETPTTETKVITSSNLATKCEIPMHWRRKVLGERTSELIRFANNVESASLQKQTTWRIPDLIAVATFIWPELVVDSTVQRMSSSTCSADPGAVKFEHYGGSNVELVTEFDVEGLKKKLLKYFV